jgi:ribosomal protein S18 acetylase RimI-like enzyme
LHSRSSPPRSQVQASGTTRWRATSRDPSTTSSAELDGSIVGYGRARLFEPEPQGPADTAPSGYYLTGLFVISNERRTGIGAALTQARLDWISDCATDAWFFANARNKASIALHERFGFEEITRHFSFPGLTFDGGEGILFRLRLDQPA